LGVQAEKQVKSEKKEFKLHEGFKKNSESPAGSGFGWVYFSKGKYKLQLGIRQIFLRN
jgi:hypothetical protein